MKYLYILACMVTAYLAKAQTPSPSGSAPGQQDAGNGDNSKSVEYLIEDTKVAHFSYSNFMASSDVELSIYVSKGMPGINGAPVFTIEFSGYSQILGNRTNVEGDIYEDEIGKAIHALQFIKDSLVIYRPTKKINYFLNMGESEFSIGAVFDPENKKAGWQVALYLDRRNADTHTAYIDPKDLADLIKALKMAQDEIKAEK